MTNRAVFVIIPAYNEAPILRETVTPLISGGYTVVIVDDGSSDQTAAAVADLPVILLHHPVNLGQGAALETGMEYARRHNAEAAVHFDADGQHAPEQIPDFIAPIARGEADVVLGSRFLRPEDAVQTPAFRRLILHIGIIVSGVFTGLWLTDTHNGLRALSRTALEQIQLRENGYAHATEILASIRRKKLRYVEVPTAIRYSAYSRSKGQSFWNSFNIVIDLVMERLFR